MYCSVHETCAERFLLHYSVSFCSPYIPGRKKNTKHAKCHIFSVISVPVCRTRPTMIRISVSQLDRKLRIMEEGRFHDTPVELLQNVHRFTSCAILQVMLNCSAHAARKRKTWFKALFRCYLCLSTHRTSKQDRLLRDRLSAKSGIIHK